MNTTNGTPTAGTEGSTKATTTTTAQPGAQGQNGAGVAQAPKSNSKQARTERALAKIAEAHVDKATLVAPKDETKATPQASPTVEETGEGKPATTEPGKEVKPPGEDEALQAPKLSKKIQELKTREAKIAERETTFAKQSNDLKVREAAISAREAKLSKDNPVGVLEALGITFSDLADAVIADSKIPASVKKQMKELADETALVKTTLADKDKKEADAQKKAADERYEQVVTTYKSNLSTFLTDSKDTYELIDLNQANDLVYDTLVEYYNEHGVLPSFKEGADMVEKFLEDRYRKMGSAKKFKPAETPQEETPAPTKRKVVTTLTNSMAAGAPSKPDKSVPMTDIERKMKAASKIKWDS